MRMGSVIRYGPGSSKTRTLNQKVETSLLSYLIRLLRQLSNNYFKILKFKAIFKSEIRSCPQLTPAVNENNRILLEAELR